MNKRTIICFAILLVSGLWYVSHKESARKDETIIPKSAQETLMPTFSKKDLENRVNYLASHVPKSPVHPSLRPVRFLIGDLLNGCGTLILNKKMEPWCIITANHLFSETQPGVDFYTYKLLTSEGYKDGGSISSVTLDSVRNNSDAKGIEDIAICYIGVPAPIARTSKVRISADVSLHGEFFVSKIRPITVTSITTGERFKLIGELVNDEKLVLFAMLYQSINGESGSGFWGDDGRLYVLSGNISLTAAARKSLDEYCAPYLPVGTGMSIDLNN